MKKFLSLVMALALTVSLVTVSAGAKDFTDDSKITYGEAVDVISALKVVDGYTDGSFNPSATLTRGAAAKIICNLILGPTTAGALGVNAAPFKDVPVSNVFAGYIAYCSQQGIINGYADGTFKPSATVTGYQFMKMLLGALGYDGSVESFTGANWTVAVAKLAVSIGLDDGNDGFVGSKAMTREEAALYAFNALQATMVQYDTKGSSIVVGGVEIKQGASKAEDVENNTTSANTIKKDGKMQFAEKYFKDLKLASGDSDAFERPANTWTYKNSSIGTYAKTADATYTAAVKLGTIYSDLGLSKTVSATDVTFYEDGRASEVGANSADYSALSITKGLDTKIGGNGVLTEVYYDDDDNTAVITLVNTYAGDINGAYAATSKKDAYVSVGARLAGGPSGDFETNEDFSVDDVVLYTYSYKSGEGVQSVAAAQTVSGTLTSFTSGKLAIVGGTTYNYNKMIANEAANAAKNFDVTVVLDTYGYAVDVDSSKVNDTYAVVLKTGTGTYSSDVIAQLLLTDGTTVDAKLTGDSAVPVIGSIYTYSVSNKGSYKLVVTAATGTADQAGSTSVANGTSLITLGDTTNIVTNGKTIFLVASTSGSSTVYNAYTGFKAVPNVTMTNSASLYTSYVVSDGVAKVVYVKATTGATVTSSTKDVVFVMGDSTVGQTQDSERGNYYTYDAIINGEVTTVDSKDPYSANKLFTSIAYDSDKVATFSGEISNTSAVVATAVSEGGAVSVTGTSAEKNGSVGLGGNYYAYADDVKVFMIDADGNISGSSINSVVNTSGVTADTAYFKISDGEISTLIIEKYSATAPVNNGVKYSVGVALAADVAKITVTPSLTATAPTVTTDLDGKLTYKVQMLNPINGNWEDANISGEFTVTDGAIASGDIAVTAIGYYRVAWTLSVTGAADKTGTTTMVQVTSLI